jgi:2-amino-4-hydroxy-6-hydroxymethyldihydropteridine diphosphokinase
VTGARPRWRPAYVGVGSNLDDPPSQVRHGCAALADLPQSCFATCSGLWRSAPMGPPDQPDFVNAVAAFLTRLEPRELLGKLQAVETAQGRQRDHARWGPRILDLDLLVLGGVVIDEPGLHLPHPGIAKRNFVLLPLAEIAPHLVVPGMGSVARLLSGLGGTAARIERMDN